MKSRRTKALAIPPKVKEKVWERDGECCVLCQQWVKMFFANAHFISRAQLGMGIEENIITLCQACHDKYDKTVERPLIREALGGISKASIPNGTNNHSITKNTEGRMQKLFIIGRLTADPEQRVTPSGISVCSFTVAVDRRFPVNGEMVTDFYRVNAWRQLGDNCAKYLSKGKKVAVMGELQARTYEDKTGKTRVSLDVSADEVEFLSPKGEAPQAAPRDDLPGFANLPEDELPFD